QRPSTHTSNRREKHGDDSTRHYGPNQTRHPKKRRRMGSASNFSTSDLAARNELKLSEENRRLSEDNKKILEEVRKLRQKNTDVDNVRRKIEAKLDAERENQTEKESIWETKNQKWEEELEKTKRRGMVSREALNRQVDALKNRVNELEGTNFKLVTQVGPHQETSLLLAKERDRFVILEQAAHGKETTITNLKREVSKLKREAAFASQELLRTQNQNRPPLVAPTSSDNDDDEDIDGETEEDEVEKTSNANTSRLLEEAYAKIKDLEEANIVLSSCATVADEQTARSSVEASLFRAVQEIHTLKQEKRSLQQSIDDRTKVSYHPIMHREVSFLRSLDYDSKMKEIKERPSMKQSHGYNSMHHALKDRGEFPHVTKIPFLTPMVLLSRTKPQWVSDKYEQDIPAKQAKSRAKRPPDNVPPTSDHSDFDVNNAGEDGSESGASEKSKRARHGRRDGHGNEGADIHQGDTDLRQQSTHSADSANEIQGSFSRSEAESEDEAEDEDEDEGEDEDEAEEEDEDADENREQPEGAAFEDHQSTEFEYVEKEKSDSTPPHPANESNDDDDDDDDLSNQHGKHGNSPDIRKTQELFEKAFMVPPEMQPVMADHKLAFRNAEKDSKGRVPRRTKAYKVGRGVL
ncbi:MAG: hypothetical protein ACRYGG_21920, partial [Janthinobacterium lividum]